MTSRLLWKFSCVKGMSTDSKGTPALPMVTETSWALETNLLAPYLHKIWSKPHDSRSVGFGKLIWRFLSLQNILFCRGTGPIHQLRLLSHPFWVYFLSLGTSLMRSKEASPPQGTRWLQEILSPKISIVIALPVAREYFISYVRFFVTLCHSCHKRKHKVTICHTAPRRF